MVSRKETQFICEAAIEAHQSPVLMRHGALAVSNGRILARGHNHYRSRSSDNIMNGGCTCHAECDVLHKLIKLPKRPKRVTMYITRIGIAGELRESAPCHNCYEKMLFFGIKTLIFTSEIESKVYFHKCNIEDFNPNVITAGQRWIAKTTK